MEGIEETFWFEIFHKMKVTVWGGCNPAVSFPKGKLGPTTTISGLGGGVWLFFTGFPTNGVFGGFLANTLLACLFSIWRWTEGFGAGAVMRQGSERIETIWNMKIVGNGKIKMGLKFGGGVEKKYLLKWICIYKRAKNTLQKNLTRKKYSEQEVRSRAQLSLAAAVVRLLVNNFSNSITPRKV